MPVQTSLRWGLTVAVLLLAVRAGWAAEAIPGLVADFALDDNQTEVVRDRSANHLIGTIHGARANPGAGKFR